MSKDSILRFSFSAPKRLVRLVSDTTKQVKVTSDVVSVPEFPEDFSAKAVLRWYAGVANDTYHNITEAAYPDLNKHAEKVLTELKRNFSSNLARVSGVSDRRMARRKAFRFLGRKDQISNNSAYKKSEMENCINGFHLKSATYPNFVSFVFRSSEQGSLHPDFVGLHSNYKGKHQVPLSVSGLNMVSGGVSSNGKKMIVPVGTSSTNLWFSRGRVKGSNNTSKGGKGTWIQDYDAAITSGGKFVYPSRNEPNPEGLPVIFAPGVNKIPVFVHNPLSTRKRRVVFWAKKGNELLLPRNVKNTLVRNGWFGSGQGGGVI